MRVQYLSISVCLSCTSDRASKHSDEEEEDVVALCIGLHFINLVRKSIVFAPLAITGTVFSITACHCTNPGTYSVIWGAVKAVAHRYKHVFTLPSMCYATLGSHNISSSLFSVLFVDLVVRRLCSSCELIGRLIVLYLHDNLKQHCYLWFNRFFAPCFRES